MNSHLLKILIVIAAFIETGLCKRCYRCNSDKDEYCLDNPTWVAANSCFSHGITHPISLFFNYFEYEGDLKDKQNYAIDDYDGYYIDIALMLSKLSCFKHTIKFHNRTVTYRDCVFENSSEALCSKLEPYVNLTSGKTTYCGVCSDSECNSGYSLQVTHGFLLVVLMSLQHNCF